MPDSVISGPPPFSVPYYPDDTIAIGMVVCSSGNPDKVKRAQANALATALALGFSTRAASPGQTNPDFIKFNGIIELTAAQWAAIIEGGGALVTGDPYYLSAATAGKITATPPAGSGDFVVLVGIAVSPDELNITLGTPTSPPPPIIV